MTRLAAALVNYNSDDELKRALDSIAREADGRWEGVVVDNGRPTAASRRRWISRRALMKNRENVGFGRGVNQAMAASTAEYVLVMNPDCQLSAGALKPLMAVLDADAHVRVVAASVSDLRWNPLATPRGDPDMLTGLFGRTSQLRRTFPGLDVARHVVTRHDTSSGRTSSGKTGWRGTVDWVSGACYARASAARLRQSAVRRALTSCIGKTPISAVGCGSTAPIVCYCRQRPPCIASVTRAARPAPPRFAPFTTARIFTTPRTSLPARSILNA
jgi:GT2 family glycosyltransferase